MSVCVCITLPYLCIHDKYIYTQKLLSWCVENSHHWERCKFFSSCWPCVACMIVLASTKCTCDQPSVGYTPLKIHACCLVQDGGNSMLFFFPEMLENMHRISRIKYCSNEVCRSLLILNARHFISSRDHQWTLHGLKSSVAFWILRMHKC